MHRDHRLPSDASLTEAIGTRLGCFESTHATFHHNGTIFHWVSRYHRKGRYPAIHHTVHHVSKPPAPRLLPVWFGYPFGDISYWVAFVFTLGCVAWVINGHYALYSIAEQGAVGATQEQAAVVAAAAALVGGTLFEVGSWLLYWEALNPEPDVKTGKDISVKQQNTAAASPAGSDGYDSTAAAAAAQLAVLHFVTVERPRITAYRLLQQSRSSGHSASEEVSSVTQPIKRNTHGFDQVGHGPAKTGDQNGLERFATPTAQPHVEDDVEAAVELTKQGATTKPVAIAPRTTSCSNNTMTTLEKQAGSTTAKDLSNRQPEQSWRWFGLRMHDIGFMASFLQLIGATIFWIPCIFGAPHVYAKEDLSNYKVWDGLYWATQVVGATFFIISGLLFMLEVQPTWYHPKPFMIGWHVGFWNFVGAAGFWLSGLFGLWAVPDDEYQLGGTVLSTFWGSYAFLIGSYLQLIEAVNKHPESLVFVKHKQV